MQENTRHVERNERKEGKHECETVGQELLIGDPNGPHLHEYSTEVFKRPNADALFNDEQVEELERRTHFEIAVKLPTLYKLPVWIYRWQVRSPNS